MAKAKDVPVTEELDDAETPETPEPEDTEDTAEDLDEVDAEGETEEEPAAAAEEEAETVEPVKPQKKPASDTIRELRARAQRAERELEESRRRPDPLVQAELERRTKAEEEEVLVSGDPAKIAKFYSDRATRDSDQKFNRLAFGVADTADRTSFETLVATNKAYAAVADEVEERLAQARAQGMNPQRRALANMLIGERVAKRGGAARTRAETRAGKEIERQQARPGSPRGDVTPQRRQPRNTHEEIGKRLDDSGQL
jgi:hypothetical protein